MNKTTLSLVALATIGGTVQAQAAMTQDEKQDAINEKKAIIDEIRKTLNAATTTVNGCADVSEQYLIKLSTIAKELNDIYEDENVLEISTDQINDFNMRIADAESAAITAQKPYTAKKTLTAEYDVLKTLLDSKLAIAKDAKYPNAGPQIAKALNDLNVTAILEKINAYDLTKQDIVNDQTAIEGEIKTATSSINKILESEKAIAALEKALADNESAHQSVVDAYTKAKASYDKELANALDALPSDNYKDWQEDVIEDLNEQYRIITSAKNEDAKDYEAGTAAEKAVERVATIENAEGKIATLVKNKVAQKNDQETAYATAVNDVKGLQTALDYIKEQLSDNKLTDCDADIASVQSSIDKLSADITTQYKAHKISTYNYAGAKTDIEKATNNISDGKGHGYQAILDNYSAYTEMNSKVAEVQKTLDNAVTAAQKASTDGNYKSAEYFTSTQKKVQDAIDALTKSIKAAFDGKTATTYKSKKFATELNGISTKQSTYNTNTAKALAAYEAIQTKVADQNKLLAKLADTMKEDPKVTVDGSSAGTSYQTCYDELTAEVKAITDKLAEAKEKKDDAHLKAMQDADKLSVASDVQTLIDNYAANKKAFDLNNAKATAQIYLDKAAELIANNKKVMDGITGDFGNQADAISKEKEEIEKTITDIEDQYKKAKQQYETAAEGDKVNAAAKAVETLSVINDNLTKTVAPEVEALNAKAAAAKENKVAYDATIKLTADGSDVKTALNDLLTHINTNATDAAKTYYTGEYNKTVTNLDGVKKEIEQAYADLKSKDMQTALAKKVDEVTAQAKNLKAAVLPNENAHKDQIKATETLLENWQAAYDAISNGDLSDEATTYLSELAGEREKITALNKDIETAFGKGQSKAKNEEIEASAKAINDAIVSISQKSKDNYDANVAKTNAAEHEAFLSAIATTKTQFGRAVDVLNEFADIKNDASKTAVDNLRETHDNIYAYADKIRQLNSTESKDYASYATATYGDESSIYTSETYCKTASQYTSEINSLLTEYQNKVNRVAYANFKLVVENAEKALNEKQATVADYLYDGHDNAFKDVADVIIKAKAAGATTATVDLPVDPMYAVNVDTWAVTLETNLDDMLDADLVKACDAEKAFLVDAITTLHASETKEIKKLTLTEDEIKTYLETIDNLKADVDVAAEEYTHDDASVYVIRMAYNNYFAASKKHSAAYEEAVSKSKDSEANLAAYDKIISYLNDAQSKLDKFVSDVKQLTIGHQNSTVTSHISYLQAEIDNCYQNAEDAKKYGFCEVYEETVKEYYVGEESTFAVNLESYRKQAIDDEIVVLGIKTDAVKEQYNQVAKTDLDKVAEYDEKIEGLYKTLLTANGGESSIQYRWEKEKLTFAEAQEELVAQEAKVAAMLQELNSLDTSSTDVADAITAINTKIAEVDEALKQAEGWANKNEATKAAYGDEVAELRTYLSDIQSDFEAKKGTILFHKDGLMWDLEKLNNIIPDETDDLYKLYVKHVKNDEAKAALDEEVKALETLMTATYEKISAFKYHYTDYDAVLESWTDYINVTKDQIAESYKNVSLVDNAATYKQRNLNLEEDINRIDKNASYSEVQAKMWNNEYSIYNTVTSEVLPIIDNSKYGAERETELRNECNRILKALYPASDYNWYTWHEGKTPFDINGNQFVDEEGNPTTVDIDYMSKAYPAVVERIAELEAAVEQLKSDAETMSYILGDADGDKKVTVNDYSVLRDFILNNVAYEDAPESQRYGADLNGNGQFEVGDLNGISNIIFGIETPSRVRASVRAASGENDIIMTKQAEEVSVFGKTVKVAVSLNNSKAFTAGQFDITLPDGMSITGNELTERSNGHEIFVNEIGDGTYRVVVATIENNAFNGNSGDLVLLNVGVGSNVADGNIQLSNAIFADAQGRSFSLGDIDGTNATGIDSINAATAKERVYSIGGQIMKTVKKGINIIVGENGETKKVIKK